MAAIFIPSFDLPPESDAIDRRAQLRVIEGGRVRSSAMRRRRRRLVGGVSVVVLALVLVLGLGFAFSALDSTSHQAVPAASVQPALQSGSVVVVQAGDTLTSIAKRLQPAGDSAGLVNRLAALHGPAPLEAGDRLPIESLGLHDASGH